MLLRFQVALVGFLVGLVCLAQAQNIGLMGAGGFKPSAGVAYAGPVDAVPGATVCWSLWACTNALVGNAALNVCNVSDVTCADVLTTSATGGQLPATITIGGTSCALVTCTVKIIYDQLLTACAGGCPMAQTTIANRAVLTNNCINSTLWCLTFTGSSSQCYSVGDGLSISLPITISSVVQRTGAFTSYGYTYSTAAGNGVGFGSSTNTWFIYNGNEVDVTAADSAWHSFQGIFGSSSSNSAVYVDGSGTTGQNAGTDGAVGNPQTMGCWYAGTVPFFTGTFGEELVYPIAFNGTQAGALTTNQRTRGGF